MSKTATQSPTLRDQLFANVATPWAKMKGCEQISGMKTTATALKAAGLDYEVGLVRAYAGKGGSFRKIPDTWSVVILDDTKGRSPGFPLGSVGKLYKPIQPRQAFAPMDPLFKKGEAEFEAGGTLFERRRLFLLARLPGDIVVGRGKSKDVTHRYILLTTTHDGSGRCQGLPLTHRPMCSNILRLGLPYGHQKDDFAFSIKHSGNIEGKIVEAQEVMARVYGEFDRFEAVAKKLVKVDGAPLFEPYVEALFPNKKGLTEEEQAAAMVQAMNQAYETIGEPDMATVPVRKNVDAVVKLVTGKKQVQTVQRRNNIAGVRMFFEAEQGDSAWHLLQAATGYANHGRALKVSGGDAEAKRMQTLVFGDAAKFQRTALEKIEELALS